MPTRQLRFEQILTSEQLREVENVIGSAPATSEDLVRDLKKYFHSIEQDLARQEIDPDHLAYVTAYAFQQTALEHARNN